MEKVCLCVDSLTRLGWAPGFTFHSASYLHGFVVQQPLERKVFGANSELKPGLTICATWGNSLNLSFSIGKMGIIIHFFLGHRVNGEGGLWSGIWDSGDKKHKRDHGGVKQRGTEIRK